MSFEAMLENSPLRPLVRERYEVKPLRDATDIGTIPHALHIECKDGNPTSLIMKHFDIKKVSAIDRDEGLIAAARAKREFEGISFSVGDVCALEFADGSFDAVFDLAELHNYADWECGVSEIGRVLKPGGLLLLEELSLESFAHAAGRFFKAMTEHPYDRMFTADDFRKSVAANGLEIQHFEQRNQFGLLKYFTMVARKGRGT